MDFNLQYITIFYGSGFMQLSVLYSTLVLGPERDGARADKMKLKQKKNYIPNQYDIKWFLKPYVYTITHKYA